MTMKCDKCSKDAVIFIRYSGSHLCTDHFSEFVFKRVKAELRREMGRSRKEEHIVAAVSGGKDSLVMLHFLDMIYRENRNFTITALTVDEGIEGYRPPSIKQVRAFCHTRDIQLKVVKFKEYGGIPMDEAVEYREDRTPCSFCGVFRRACLNGASRELGATRLATGLNLDDTAQTILMNLCRGDVQRLTRLGPHKIVKPGLIPRIQPLRMIPEKENYLFAVMEKIDFHDGICPYFAEAQRNIYRNVIEQLEEATPGTRHSLVKTYDQLYGPLTTLFPESTVNECTICREPTSGKVCKICESKLFLEDRMCGKKG